MEEALTFFLQLIEFSRRVTTFVADGSTYVTCILTVQLYACGRHGLFINQLPIPIVISLCIRAVIPQFKLLRDYEKKHDQSRSTSKAI